MSLLVFSSHARQEKQKQKTAVGINGVRKSTIEGTPAEEKRENRRNRIMRCVDPVSALSGWGVDPRLGSSTESRQRQDVSRLWGCLLYSQGASGHFEGEQQTDGGSHSHTQFTEKEKLVFDSTRVELKTLVYH